MKNWRSALLIVFITGSFSVALSGCLKLPGRALQGIKAQASPTTASTSVPAEVAMSVSLANADDAIVLTTESDSVGSVYYAVFNVDPGVLTAAQVKTWGETAAPNGSLVASGEIAIGAGDVGAEIETQIPSLPDKSLYTVFAVAEGANGLAGDSSVVKFAKVIPRRLSLQNYASAIAGAGSGMTIRYSIYFPQGYYDDPDAEFPLLIYLGGAGEIPNSAANLETIFTTGQYRIGKTPYPANIALGQDYPFIVVVPQCNSALFTCASYSQTAWTHEVVTTIQSTHRVDSKRIYMVGMSNGGGGVWNYLIAHPEKIAAAVPVAATSFSYTGGAAGTLCAASASNVAVWAIHNTNDSVVAPTSSTNAVTAWNNCASVTKSAKYLGLPGTVFPATEGTHNTIEYVVNSQWVRYSPTPAALDPTAIGRVGIEPRLATELSVLEGAAGVPIDTIEDWLMRHSKP